MLIDKKHRGVPQPQRFPDERHEDFAILSRNWVNDAFENG